MPDALRKLVARLRPQRVDLLLAAIFTIAGIAWALGNRHDASAGPLHIVNAVPTPTAPKAPIAPGPYPVIVKPDDGSDQGATTAALATGIVAAVPLAIRRRLPYTAVLIALGGVFVIHGGLNWPGFLAVLILAYSVVAYGRYPAGSLCLLLVAAAIAAHEFARSIPSMPGWLSPFAVLVPIGLAAATIRSTRDRADAAARRAQSLEREKEAGTRAAIAEERARIARELHDVVSHHVSVMVIQAGAAGKVIDARPDLATAALASIEASGREAMGELRHLLGLVAPLDDRLHPQPGLDNLEALVDSVRAAGQPVTIRHESGAVPAGVDLTAYRVVQEGLTNAMRYAPGASTEVNLCREAGTLVVEVRNDAPAADAPRSALGSGAGLVGLAERLRLHDGTLDTGRRLGGGFRLTARIPLYGAPGLDTG
ncbi:MAG TPA: histidine kinase [Micromonosporaceae bacterium]